MEEAIATSNAIYFGLSVSIFSEITAYIEKYISKFEEGWFFVNDFARSEPRLSFGGVKCSGYGRELIRVVIKEFIKKNGFIK